MNLPVQRWLEPFPWAAVEANNAAICQHKSALHKPTSEGYQPARARWEAARGEAQTLFDALELCRECHRLAPFCFYNGNTFAGIARAMIHPLLQDLAAPTAFVLRSTVGHYVAGTIGQDELEQVLAAVVEKISE